MLQSPQVKEVLLKPTLVYYIMLSSSAFFVAVLAACMSASAIPLDVWDPKITSPVAGDVWAAGSTHNITWDTSDAPAHISEGSEVQLSKSGILDSAHPLVTGFDLRAGFVPVTIPADTVPGTDYAIVLFGDSGNASPLFTIV